MLCQGSLQLYCLLTSFNIYSIAFWTVDSICTAGVLISYIYLLLYILFACDDGLKITHGLLLYKLGQALNSFCYHMHV